MVAHADMAARAVGLRAGMTGAEASALVPGLHKGEADPEGDAAALVRLARWMHGDTPLVAVAGPATLVFDLTGCLHLHGGQDAYVSRLAARFLRWRIGASIVMAPHPTTAVVLARAGYGGIQDDPVIVRRLDLEALALEPRIVAGPRPFADRPTARPAARSARATVRADARRSARSGRRARARAARLAGAGRGARRLGRPARAGAGRGHAARPAAAWRGCALPPA